MNRTLLLIICDFLLLNLLALTRWESSEPVQRPATAPTTEAAGVGAATAQQDLVDAMRLSLEDERAQRTQLAQELQATASSLSQREETLAKELAEKSRLAETLQGTEQKAADLAQKVEQAARDASVSRERLTQLQRDLEQRELEAKRQKEQLGELQRQQTEARQRIENLSVAVKVAEQEKSLLRETAETLKQQVEAEREERAKVQETTTQLAQGVGALAQTSSEITKEIRENRPISANVLFNDFLANRVKVRIAASRPGILGSIDRSGSSDTVMVSDGRETYALVHLDETPFGVREPAADWTKVRTQLQRGVAETTASSLQFLSLDPRVVAVPLSAEQVAMLGGKVYLTALDPFKFSDAVLVSNDGLGYGEVSFKLDAETPGYVRMDNRLFKRIFGDFSPSRGDLVISRTGEILGVMVTGDYCAVINNFLPTRTLKTADPMTEKSEAVLEAVAGRVRALPFRLQ